MKISLCFRLLGSQSSAQSIRLIYARDETIRRLEEKNARLQSEINRIDRVLQEPEEKTIYGIKIPQLKK